MTLLLSLLAISGVATGLILWTVYGLPWVLDLTFHVIEFCQSLLVRCIESADLIELGLFWLGAGVLAAGFAYAAIKCTAGIIRARLIVRRLPLSKRCGSVVLIRDGKCKAAFTHGLFQPTIYLSTGLINSLDWNELKAVFFHELHHKRSRDPLKFFLLSFLKDSFFYLPAARNLVGYIRFRKENEADDAAVVSMKDPLSLASALLKVVSSNKVLNSMPVSINGGIEGGVVRWRVLRLLENKDVKLKLSFSPRSAAVSIFISVCLLLSLALPLNASLSGHQGCGMDHCAVHANKPGNSCTKNCRVS